MKYHGYARVSTQGQKDTSIEVQLEYLRLQAERIGFEFEGHHEKASGKNVSGRSVFTSLINSVKSGDILGVYDNSRLGRNTQENLFIISNLNSKGVQVQINGKIVDLNNPQDKLLFSVESAVSTYQRESQLLKSEAGRIQRKKNGDFVTKGNMFGWDVIKSRGKTIATINETEAGYVRYIFEEYNKGKQPSEIYKSLMDVVDTDKCFVPNCIRVILSRTLYMGYYPLCNAKDIKHTMSEDEVKSKLVKSNIYPPIISEELFWSVWNKYRPATNLETKRRYSQFESTGLIKCPECGAPIYHYWKTWTNKSGTHKIPTYEVLQHKPTCTHPVYRTFEAKYIDLMMRLLFLTTFTCGDEIGEFFKDKRVMLNETAENLKEQLEVIKNEIKEVDGKIDRIIDAISDGIFTPEMAKKKMEGLKEERKEKEKDYRNINEAYLLNQGELDDILRSASEDSITEYVSSTANGRKKMNEKYLKYAYLYEDRFEIEYLNGKKFVVIPWEAKKIKKEKMEFTMYFKGEEQAKGKIDLINFTLHFYPEGEDEFSEFANKYYRRIEDQVNEMLSHC